jgi:hypothetical protein
MGSSMFYLLEQCFNFVNEQLLKTGSSSRGSLPITSENSMEQNAWRKGGLVFKRIILTTSYWFQLTVYNGLLLSLSISTGNILCIFE